MKTIEKLQDIMRDLFENENLCLTEDTSMEDVPEWDSFAHIQLCMALQSEFKMKLTTKQAMDIRNVGDILKIVSERKE